MVEFEEMMIREMTFSDIPALYSIELATQLAPWNQETFEKCLQAKCQGWVVIDSKDHIIGFIIVLMQIGECHILNLCVDPTTQRQGLGTQLLTHALTNAKEKGMKLAYLEVRCSNENAIALYKKKGFTKIGERKGYYSAAEGNEDAWVLVSYL